jgi:hypothetical protein
MSTRTEPQSQMVRFQHLRVFCRGAMAAASPGGDAVAGELLPPDEFPFPFPAYGVQKDFMRQLWTTVERGHLGKSQHTPSLTLAHSLTLTRAASRWRCNRLLSVVGQSASAAAIGASARYVHSLNLAASRAQTRM